MFYFLEGRHVLNDTTEINGVSNMTLKGLGTMEQGFHYTVLQSTVEINCEGAVSAGLVFINVSNVSISDLLITRCSGPPLRQSSKEFSDHLMNNFTLKVFFSCLLSFKVGLYKQIFHFTITKHMHLLIIITRL